MDFYGVGECLGIDEPAGPGHRDGGTAQLVLQCTAVIHRLRHRPVEELQGVFGRRIDHGTFVGEVLVDRAAGHPGGTSDVDDRGLAYTLGAEAVQRCFQDDQSRVCGDRLCHGAGAG